VTVLTLIVSWGALASAFFQKATPGAYLCYVVKGRTAGYYHNRYIPDKCWGTYHLATTPELFPCPPALVALTLKHLEKDKTTTSIAIIAIVAALALLGVVVTVVTISQEAEARGCKSSIAFNASKGRCFHPR
jgi:hypothetical protein